MHSDDKSIEDIKHLYENTLNTFAKCKMIPLFNYITSDMPSLHEKINDQQAYKKERDESMKLRETNSELQNEVNQFRNHEKNSVNSLTAAREMINKLQKTVSELVYLKSDNKNLQEEVTAKKNTIAALQKERENLISVHNNDIEELEITYEWKMKQVDEQHEEQIMQIQEDKDTQLAQFTCVIAELRAKIKNMESEHCDKMNILVLEYEEKIQKSAAEITKLKDQQSTLVARADANVEAYRKRLEEIEEKWKINQFKQLLAQNSTSLYESPVERPYSTTSECTCNDRPNVTQRTKPANSNSTIETVQKTTIKTPNPLPIYYNNNYNNLKRSDEKRTAPNVKKRKLFNVKNVLD